MRIVNKCIFLFQFHFSVCSKSISFFFIHQNQIDRDAHSVEIDRSELPGMNSSEHEKNRFQKFSVITFCFFRLLLLLGDFSLLLLFICIIQLLVHNSQKEKFFHLNLIQFKYRHRHLVFRIVLNRFVRFLKFLLKLGSRKKNGPNKSFSFHFILDS